MTSSTEAIRNPLEDAVAVLNEAGLPQLSALFDNVEEDKRAPAVRSAILSVLNDLEAHYHDPAVFSADLRALNALKELWKAWNPQGRFDAPVLSLEEKLELAAKAVGDAGHAFKVSDPTLARVAFFQIGSRLNSLNREQFSRDMVAIKSLVAVFKHPQRSPVVTVLDKLPDSTRKGMRCDARCTECCGVVAVSEEDLQRVMKHARDNGIKPRAQGLLCPYFQEGRCAVHSVRPAICQAFGYHSGLPCPRGYNVNMDLKKDPATKHWVKDPEGEKAFFHFLGEAGPLTRFLHEALLEQEPEGQQVTA